MFHCIYKPLYYIITQITQIITKWGSRGCCFYPFSFSYTMKFQVKYNKKMLPLEPWIGSFFFKSTLFLQIPHLHIYDLPITPIFLFYYYIVSILSNQDDLFTNYNLFHWYLHFLLSFIQTKHKQCNITTLYSFFNNSNKQTTFIKLCFYFSHH